MALDIFFATHLPDESTAPEEVTPQVERYEFGDGYTQRVGIGAADPRESWKVVYALLTLTDVDAMVTFAKAKNGVTAFEWTPPGESSVRVYTCKSWRKVPKNSGRYNFEAFFVEEYDI